MATKKKSGVLKANIKSLPFTNSIAQVANSYYGQRGGDSEMLRFGQQMRDDYISRFPLMGGAVQTYQTLAANREFRISGRPKEANRALKFLNNARTVTYDGMEEVGMYQWLQRLAIDSVTIGRFMWTWNEEAMEYLDPAYMRYEMQTNDWHDRWMKQKVRYPHNKIVLNHTMPMGRSGRFISPLLNVLPSAILEWLVREHDLASSDGRKIRDIKIVVGEDVAEQIIDAIASSVAEYDGSNPGEHNVHVVYIDDIEGKRSAGDIIATLGLANIPESFDRGKSKFSYVNEIANATGLTVRQFWNAEEATNRALEQVQQERQLARGPGNFARVVQRKINSSGCISQFGKSVRMSFWEEIDAASKKVNAEVILAYSTALEKFATVFNGTINGDAFLSWLQAEGVLPADLDLITDMGIMTATDSVATPQDGERIIDSDVTAAPGLTSQNGSDKGLLDYDEVTLNMEGQIVDRRHKIISFKRVLIQDILKEDDAETKYQVEIPDFKTALEESRKEKLALFRDKYSSIKSTTKKNIPEKEDELEDFHHRMISDLIMSEPDIFTEAV